MRVDCRDAGKSSCDQSVVNTQASDFRPPCLRTYSMGASRLVRPARKGDVANAALDGLDPRYGVHEPHGLDDHALVAESALEHDLSGRDFRVYAKGRGGAAEPPIK